MKVCIIGGGSTYTPELIEGLINIEEAVGIKEVVLIDIEEGREKLNILSAFSERILRAQGSAIKLRSSLDPLDGIKNADVVLNQFRAGCLQGRTKDEKVPLKYGLIGQETTGMGGMANGIRAMKFMEEYVAMIREYSNNAWIINFTNPSGMLTEYIVNYLKYEKCVGLCNVPVEFILKSSEIFECSKEDIFLKYYGLNHLAWVEEVKVLGDNRTDELWDNFKINMKNIPDLDYNESFLPVIRLLLNSYLKYFYKTGEMLEEEKKDFYGEGTRAEQIVMIEKELLALYSEEGRSKVPEELSQRGGFMYSTVATELVRDLVTDAGIVHIVNTGNGKGVSNMPDDYIMEIPCKIGSKGAEPIEIGKAHPMTIGLIHTIKQYERLTIEGYINKDENLIKQAMMVNPLGPDETDLDALWADLKEANEGYFPEF